MEKCECKKPKRLTPSVCPICGIPVLGRRSDTVYHKDCDRIRAKQNTKLWYRKQRETEGFLEQKAKESREFRKKHPENRMLTAAKERAKSKDIPFNIDLSDIKIPEFCPILGNKLETGTRYAPSLDKIDPTKGYVKGNVWVISWKANTMKQDASAEELKRFSEWIRKSVV